MKRVVVVAGWIACSSSAAPRPANQADLPATKPPTISVAQDLGQIGLGVEHREGTGSPWPVAPTAAVALGQIADTVTLIGDGKPARYSAQPLTKIRYGCDNTLTVRPLVGPAVPAGPVWILPDPLPTGWQVRSVAVVSDRSPARRHTTIGAFTFDTERISRDRARLRVVQGSHLVHTSDHQRSVMDGADTSQPIDLTTSIPGITEPIAAWAIAGDEPLLVVFVMPGYEGTTLRPALVDADGVRYLEDMAVYLYACAF